MDRKISQLTNYTTPVSADVLPIVDTANTTTKKVTMANLFNILASLFTIKDSSDTTKKVAFDVSGVATATTRTLTVPNANTTIAGTDATQTLTNKTLGNPTKINTSGSDGVGAIYYRDSGGNLTDLPIGSAGQILDVSAGLLPEWIANPAASDATYTQKGVKVLDANSVYYGADGGGSDAYAITLTPALNAYAVGQVFTFKANTANTGAATIAINGLAAKTIVKGVNTTLADGDIAAGQIVTIVYDGTNFVLQNPTQNTVVSGIASYSLLQTLTINTTALTGVSTKIVEFLSLTGNTDDNYLIEFELNNSIVPGDATQILSLRFNDDSGANYAYSMLGLKTSNAAYNKSSTGATAGLLSQSDTSFGGNLLYGTIKIKASRTLAGTLRTAKSDVELTDGGTGISFNGGVNWSDTTNQITSLQLYLIQSSGSTTTITGKASIYKINR